MNSSLNVFFTRKDINGSIPFQTLLILWVFSEEECAYNCNASYYIVSSNATLDTYDDVAKRNGTLIYLFVFFLQI